MPDQKLGDEHLGTLTLWVQAGGDALSPAPRGRQTEMGRPSGADGFLKSSRAKGML